MGVWGRIRPSREVSAADWVVEGIAPFEAFTVGSLVPTGFESYARVFHPAWGPEGMARWADVAAWSGRVMHAHAEYELLREPVEGGGRAEMLWEDPDRVLLPEELVTPLAEVLGRHTATPGRCWFCVWEGNGLLHGPMMVGIRVDIQGEAREQLIREQRANWKPPVPAELMRDAIVRLPKRDYVLFEGPLDALPEFGYSAQGPDGRSFFERLSPDLMWPDDHTWFMATDIDLDSTYVGGTNAIVDAVVADARIEALAVNASDPRGDSVNQPD